MISDGKLVNVWSGKDLVMTATNTESVLQNRARDVFWGEIAPCEHLVEIYDCDTAFLNSLEGFVIGGLRVGDGVIVIATEPHLQALNARLESQEVDLASARSLFQYIPLNAEETLAKFMVDGSPDEERFERVVTELLERARQGERRIRAFGEMVSVLWAQGQNGATIRLEHLWHKFCQAQAFSLFCAYPRSGFTQDAAESVKEICAAHTKVIGATWSGTDQKVQPI
jgi:hypothetical protein